MPVLIDANILLRSAQLSHPLYEVADRAVKILTARNENLFVSIQNIAEFWNVTTRPIVNNGLGFSIERAKEEIAKIDRQFEIISETIDSYRLWKTVVADYAVSGVQVHDARLVSVMRTNGIYRILTFNTKDFTRFDGIEAVHPDGVG